ncbi:MAG: decaprenyl-phosphate phosphoribosyltransferase, partial [Myxococcota bacterium]|nr:decaprenyl-phosphate phosphoribosyltransferase [Myxococcota bacterium]
MSDPNAAPIAPSGPSGPTDLALAMVQGLRPKQWAKQVFVLAGIIFSLRFFELGLWIKTAGAVAAFCCFASCGYLVNDLRDREADRQHPKKRKRPIAS